MWSERLAGSVAGDTLDVAEKIRRGSEHAMRLVQDVLDLESLAQGRLETWPRMIVVNDLLQAAMDGIHPEAEKKNMRLRLKRNRSKLRMVADPDRVLQVITNLLSNAIKYSPAGTEVWLEAELRRKGPQVVDGAEQWIAIGVADRRSGTWHSGRGPGADLRRVSEGSRGPKKEGHGNRSHPFEATRRVHGRYADAGVGAGAGVHVHPVDAPRPGAGASDRVDRLTRLTREPASQGERRATSQARRSGAQRDVMWFGQDALFPIALELPIQGTPADP